MSGGYVLENGDFVEDTSQNSSVLPVVPESACGAFAASQETTQNTNVTISVTDQATAVDSTGG